MTERCGCYREGDAIVFGDVHECSKDPSLSVRRLKPWWEPRPYRYEVVLSDDAEPGDLG